MRLLASTLLFVSVTLLCCGYRPDPARTPDGLERVQVVSASSSNSFDKGLCVLAADGQAHCVSTYYEDSKSVEEDWLTGATSLVEGGVCGLFADGALKCNYDGTKTTWATEVVQAQLENGYLCFVNASSGVTCRQSYGEVWELPLTQSAKQVTVSEDQVCVLLANSQVECWSRSSRASVGMIGDLAGASQIALTHHQRPGSRPGLIWGCALVSGGEVRCWNSVMRASLAITLHDKPEQRLANVVSVAAAGTRGCALTSDGSVYCWGSFVFNPGNDASDGAWLIPGIKNAVALTLGRREHSYIDCALSSEGKLSCWGSSTQVGPSFGFYPPVP